MKREEEIKRAKEQIIDPIVAEFLEQGINAEGIVRHGHAADTLSALAKEYEATNIMIGRQGGSSRIKTQLFGSVASTLVQIAEVPVTVVP